MTPTQIVEIDTSSAPRAIRVRDDARGMFVVVSTEGRPVDLLRLSKPRNGVISSGDLLASSRAEVRRPAMPKQRSSTPISVVVCTHERPDDLARCLERLVAIQTDGHELIVVDSGPVSDRTSAVVRRYGVRSVVEPILGLNRARNAGVAAASHDIVAFVDDDVVVGRSWVEAVRAAFDESEVACVTGLVLPLELETPGQEEFELYCQHRRDLQRRVYSRRTLRSSAAGVVGMGANMAFRRDVVRALGGFDVRLGPPRHTRAADETDMFARVLDAGHLIVYTPDAQVWHRHRRSTREVRSCVFGYGVGVYSMLTKRLLEQGDLGALITAARWFVGPVVKAASAKAGRRPAPRWDIVLAETAGAAIGPFCYAYEAWRGHEA
jgi:GT2 family glycosyltransferase